MRNCEIRKRLINLLARKQEKDPLSNEVTRIGIYVLGGIGLGTWLAQKPGAIVGSTIALAYGIWYEYFSE